jgi:hypothetical protein
MEGIAEPAGQVGIMAGLIVLILATAAAAGGKPSRPPRSSS